MAWLQVTGPQRAAYSLLLTNGLDTPAALQSVIDDAALKDGAEAERDRLTGENSRLRVDLKGAQDALDQAGIKLQEREATIASRDAEIAELRRRIDDLTKPPAPAPPPAPTNPPPAPEEPTPAPEIPPGEPPPAPTPAPPPPPPDPEPAPPTEPSPNPTPPPQVVQDLQVSATYHAMTVTLPGTFPPAADVDSLVYRRVGDPDWTKGLPLWSHGDQLTGSVFPLDSDTEYEVRVTVDGVTHGGVGRTKKDALPTHAELVGMATGTVPGTYPTLEDAIRNAPSGAVVVVDPGTYERPKSSLTRPLTLVSREIGGAAIGYGRGTTPGDGKWQSVTLAGPGFGGAPKGEMHQAWTWTLPDKRPPSTLAYAAGTEIPTRLAHWDRKGTDLDSPAGFVEKVRTNRTYNVGWTSFANPDSTTTLYAVFPPDVDPNTLTVTAGELPTSSTASTASLFVIAGPDIRLCGFRLLCGRVTLTAAAKNCTLDHNAFDLSLVKVEGAKPGTYGADHLLEHNTLTETNVWTDDHANKPAIPWVFIKGGIQNADGSVYSSPTGTAYGRLGAGTERTAIWNGGGAHRLVIRRNTIEGFFNAIGGYGSGFDRHATKDNDVYENTIRRIADDAFEPEHAVTNWRAWNNRLEDVCVVLSMGPVNYGPLYLLENTAWKIGPHGTGRTNLGEVGASGKGIKFSGSSQPTARAYLLNNTFWTDDPDGVSGAEQSAGGGSQQEAFYLRDNIFRFTKYAFAAPGGTKWDEDGNHFATTDQARGLSYAGVKFGQNVQEYRDRSGHGKRTNEHAAFTDWAWLDAQLEDPQGGNLTVRAGSPLGGKGAG